MKKLLPVILIILLLISAQTVFADTGTTQGPAVSVNGTPILLQASVKEGELFLPVRAVSEALGYTVGWSGQDRAISIQNAEKSFLLSLKESKIKTDGHEFYMREIPFLIDNRTYIGRDFFADEMGLKIAWDKAGNRVSISNIRQNSISVTNSRLTASDPRELDATIQYPVIGGLENKSVGDQINSTFKALAQQALKEGEKNATDLAPLILQNPDIPWKCEVYFDYQIKYNQNGLLSVAFQNYQFAGGAHGSTIQTAYTFDLSTGNQLQLADLFKANSDYVSVISDRVQSQLKERDLFSALFDPFENIRPDHSYYLTCDGVVVYYQQYEILAYAAGIQEFTTDYSLLGGLLRTPELFEPVYLMPAKPGSSWPIVQTGDLFSVSLNGNPTTGYTWHYTIENKDIASGILEEIVPDSDLIGAGSTFTWTLKALKPGETRILFKYYRDWEGESSATPENTIIYKLKAE